MVVIKRIYEAKSPDDGCRVLVDRLWPRGLSKNKAGIDLWLKEIAPSDELRKWFNHDPAKWPEFQKRYQAELKEKSTEIENLRKLEKDHGTVTLLYGARDETHNQAAVIMGLLKRKS